MYQILEYIYVNKLINSKKTMLSIFAELVDFSLIDYVNQGGYLDSWYLDYEFSNTVQARIDLYESIINNIFNYELYNLIQEECDYLNLRIVYTGEYYTLKEYNRKQFEVANFIDRFLEEVLDKDFYVKEFEYQNDQGHFLNESFKTYHHLIFNRQDLGLSFNDLFIENGLKVNVYNSYSEDFKYLSIKRKLIMLGVVYTIHFTELYNKYITVFDHYDLLLSVSDEDVVTCTYKSIFKKGNFYDLYRVKQNHLVLKKIKITDTTEIDLAVDSINHEYQQMQKIGGHPNIMTVYNQEDDYSYTLEKLKTNLVATLLKDLSLTMKISILIDICNGLTHAHNNDVVHGHLHPGNILFTADSQVILSDFGITYYSFMHPLNRDSTKLKYYAPEVIHDFEQISTASDIYSLGAIMSFDFNLPSEYNYIWFKATERNPKLRYQTANEIIRDLLSINNPKMLAKYRTFINLPAHIKYQVIRDCSYEIENIINIYNHNNLMFVLYDILRNDFVEQIKGDDPAYDIFNNFMYEIAINEKVDLEMRSICFKELQVDHGNRFYNPINKIDVKTRKKLLKYSENNIS